MWVTGAEKLGLGSSKWKDKEELSRNLGREPAAWVFQRTWPDLDLYNIPVSSIFLWLTGPQAMCLSTLVKVLQTQNL